MLAVFIKKKLVLSGVVFAPNKLKNTVNLKALPLHFLVMTSALVVVSSFYEV